MAIIYRDIPNRKNKPKKVRLSKEGCSRCIEFPNGGHKAELSIRPKIGSRFDRGFNFFPKRIRGWHR